MPSGISPGGRPIDESPLGTGKNWVTKAGGLPGYIRGVARGIAKKHGGKVTSADIAEAIGRMKVWAAGGDGVHPAVQAAAAAAIAEFEAKAKAAHSLSNVGGTLDFSRREDLELAIANFGGKKAAPFGSKQSDAKKVAAKNRAKAKWTKAKDDADDKAHGIKDGSPADKKLDAKRGVKDMARTGAEDIALGKDGAKWKHGYIPENAAAVALKEHRKPGSSGASKGSAQVKANATRVARKAEPLNVAVAQKPKRSVKVSGDYPGHGPTEHSKVKAQLGATHAKKPQHIYLTNEQRKSLSDVALKEHVATHTAAAERARSTEHTANHKNEALLAKRELARRAAAKKRAEKPKPSEVAKAAAAHKKSGLGKLSDEELGQKLLDGSLSAEDRRVLTGEQARRLAEGEQRIRALHGDIAKSGIDVKAVKGEDIGRFFSILEKHAPPQIKAHLERIRKSRTSQSLKHSVNLEKLLEFVQHGIVVTVVAAAVGGPLVSALGLKAGGG
jgi:hypothetical protein